MIVVHVTSLRKAQAQIKQQCSRNSIRRCVAKRFWEHISKLEFSTPMDHMQQARKN
uniref:Uncharacterized protein n=1 Tax=Arundo donax TaxID=35708 RepID=A0A0A9SCY1_ARUDO